MNSLSKYIIAQENQTDLPAIIRTEPPYLIARPKCYEGEWKWTTPHAKVNNYRMVLVPDGCLVGHYNMEYVQPILEEMAEVYYNLVAHPRYQRLKNFCEDRQAELDLKAEIKKMNKEMDKQRKFAKVERELFG